MVDMHYARAIMVAVEKGAALNGGLMFCTASATECACAVTLYSKLTVWSAACKSAPAASSSLTTATCP